MLLLEQLPEAWLFLCRSIQRSHERLPLLVVEDEARLVRQRLLSLLASTAQNELGDVHSLAFRCHLYQFLFRRSRAQLESTVSGLLC